MLINNVELPDIDVYDVDIMEKYETASENLTNYKAPEGGTTSEQWRQECLAIFSVFNQLWGEGSDKLVFGDTMNIKTCWKAMGELFEEIIRQKEEGEMLFNKYNLTYEKLGVPSKKK